jgi:Fic family protein
MQASSLEPLLPSAGDPLLAELTCEILSKAGRLAGQMPSAVNCAHIAALIAEMNSYYSNLIEGHKTLPGDIERALRADYSDDPAKRANQELARAHIEVENLMVQRLRAEPETAVQSTEFICWLHGEFYRRLPGEVHFGKTREGKTFRIEPGKLRSFEVRVGSHQPPHFGSLPALMDRFSSFYASPEILSSNQLVALAAAHHRLAWIHPFGDGNGRVIRLFSHAWLMRCNGGGLGLWTLSRGLARQREDYFAALARADAPRQGDLDGRGNLSDKFLSKFCEFFLKVIIDQIDFMIGRLQLNNLSTRVGKYLELELLHLEGRQRERLARLLKAALYEGEIERGRVAEILGVGATTARGTIRLALREELLQSPTEKGPLSLRFSSRTMDYYFPGLFDL